MEAHGKFNIILLVQLMTVCWIKATLRTQKFYYALEPGQNVTGKVTEIYAVNAIDCILR